MTITMQGTNEELGRACYEERRRVDAILNDGAPCGPYPPWEEVSEECRESWRVLAPKLRTGELTISDAAAGKS